jgi:hypothetical protein
MQLRAFHDSHGNITALVVSPPDALALPAQIIEIQPGQQIDQRVTEVEAPPEMTRDLDDAQQLNEDLSNLMQNFRVEIKGDKGELTRND